MKENENFRDIIKKTGSIMLDLVFPPRCCICDGIMEPGKRGLICPECTGHINIIREPVCMKCGRPCREDKEFCSQCQGRRWNFDSGKCICEYDEKMRRSVTFFKYHGRQEYGEGYASLIYENAGEWLKKSSPDFFVPVPAHRDRVRQRGYNQAAVLAYALEKKTGIPVNEELLVRVKHTARQKDLNADERRDNIRDAFRFCGTRVPFSVCLVDDIFTTGATLDECAGVLRKNGVRKIYFMAFCAGVSPCMEQV